LPSDSNLKVRPLLNDNGSGSNFLFTDDIEVEEYFPLFVDMIKQVLDGNLDGNQFEDTLRDMFGIHAYIGFTMDKVVQNICRQLQHIACDESCSSCTDVYLEELKLTGGLATGGSLDTQATRLAQETVYQKKVEQILQEENCFKIMFHKLDGKVTIELLDTDSNESEYGAEVERWSEYIEKYLREDTSISEEIKERLCKSKPVFLPRNIPLWRRKAAGDTFASTEQSTQPQAPNNRSDSQQSNNNDKTEEDRENESTEKMEVDSPSKEDGKTSQEVKDPKGNEEDLSSSKPEVDLTLKDLENNECRFNVNNYKMLFVIEGESYVYRRNSISRARSVSFIWIYFIGFFDTNSLLSLMSLLLQTHKQVSQTMFSRFNRFHSKWLQKEVDDEESKLCSDWLEGVIADPNPSEKEEKDGEVIEKDSESDAKKSCSTSRCKPNTRTKKIVFDRQESAPFRTFCKYKVDTS